MSELARGTSGSNRGGGTASPAIPTTATPVRRDAIAPRADRLPVRMLIGLVVAVGGVALAWLMGAIGHRLGFAMAMRLPELDTGGTRALATGIMLLVGIPGMVLEAGIRQPMWLLAGFLLLAFPAGGLAAAAPTPRGDGPENPVHAALANIGAVLGMLTAAGLLWWTGSPVRIGLMRPMPADPDTAAAWPVDLSTAAGLDVLAVIVAALWVVLVFRLPVPGWLRALSATACLFGLVVSVVALSVSGGTATQVTAQRSVVGRPVAEASAESPAPMLLLGRAGDRDAVLVSTDGRLEVELTALPAELRILGRASIADAARDAAGRDR